MGSRIRMTPDQIQKLSASGSINQDTVNQYNEAEKERQRQALLKIQQQKALANQGLQNRVVQDQTPLPITSPTLERIDTKDVVDTPVAQVAQTTDTIVDPITKDIVTGEKKTIVTKGKEPTTEFRKAQEDLITAEENRRAAEINALKAQQAAETEAFNLRQESDSKMLELANKEEEIRQKSFNNMKKRMEGIDEQVENLSNEDYKGFWTNQNTGTKIGAALAMALGAYAQGVSGGKVPNTALSIINKAMDDDFNQFKTRQANKIKAIQQSRLSANQKQQLTEQELDKLRARKVAENNQLKKKLDELAQNTKNPQVLAKIQQINAEADRRMAQDRLKVEGELTKDTQTSIVQDIQKVQIDPTTGQVKTKDTIDVTKLSPGEKKRDETFAKQYTDFSSSKGLPVVEKNLARLRAAKEDLQRRIDEGDTGDDRFYGRLPDVFKFEEDISLRDAVHSSAVGALRATLGAQFTEKEGTRIMNQSFNETLSAKENLKRVQLALDELESGKEGMIDQGKYFEQYGTLKGYKLPTNKKTQPTKTESKRQYNAKLDMTRIIYDDGSMEELPGKQIKK